MNHQRSAVMQDATAALTCRTVTAGAFVDGNRTSAQRAAPLDRVHSRPLPHVLRNVKTGGFSGDLG